MDNPEFFCREFKNQKKDSIVTKKSKVINKPKSNQDFLHNILWKLVVPTAVIMIAAGIVLWFDWN